MANTEAGRPGLAEAKRAAPLLAVLLALLAAWFGWSGVTQWRGEARERQLGQARDQAVAATATTVAAQAARLGERLQAADVQAALAAGDAGAAATAVAAAWPQAEQVSVLGADLAGAYGQPAEFGYSRLALLEHALSEGRSVAAVVRDEGQVRLGVAAPVQLAGAPAVAYARLPLGVLTAGFEQAAVPAEAYLALRQGNHSVFERGNAGLAGSADALSRPIGQTGLRAAAAVPDVATGPLGLGAIPCLVVAA
ncbi:MAG TPA: phosphomannomutase/phosphoglucomutase, partial [Pseudoxanthomonas sp.]|nr:phosphomannomutase/phosphoglucomutase [Pseudoxanthomonas sp.]